MVSALLAWTIVPADGVLRGEDGLVSGSPFLKSIVAFIFIFFAIPGYVYGRVVGTMKTDRDVINAMAKSMSSMGMYIVLVFLRRSSLPSLVGQSLVKYWRYSARIS